jgi:hypothetical protein
MTYPRLLNAGRQHDATPPYYRKVEQQPATVALQNGFSVPSTSKIDWN